MESTNLLSVSSSQFSAFSVKTKGSSASAACLSLQIFHHQYCTLVISQRLNVQCEMTLVDFVMMAQLHLIKKKTLKENSKSKKSK